MPPEAWTILKLLDWATAYFKSHHIEQPRPDAEILLAYALDIERIDLYVQYDRPLESTELATFRRLIQRRVDREPVAYIVGEKGFWSLDLKVTPDVLIPRPETEILVEVALSIIPSKPLQRTFRILDLGTGSGAVVLALARERAGHCYYAIDCSHSALTVARDNARSHGLDKAISFSQGNWFDAVSDKGRYFDVIVSNPPYIPHADLDMLPQEISRYEPRQALDGGPDGLDSIRLIIEKAATYIIPGGWLLFEIGHDQWASVEQLMTASTAYADVTVVKDYSGLDRVVRARAKSGPDRCRQKTDC
jgi:release factor glutamine methyltransferase